mgnify:CR=1 FL=1
MKDRLEVSETQREQFRKEGYFILEHVLPDHFLELLRGECQHFIDCIEQGTQPLTDVAEGLRVLKVLDRAEAALQASLGEKK